jgi:hypothetical protein
MISGILAMLLISGFFVEFSAVSNKEEDKGPKSDSEIAIEVLKPKTPQREVASDEDEQ